MAFQNTIEPREAERTLTKWLAGRMPDARNLAVIEARLPARGGFSAETVMFTAQWSDAEGTEHRDRMVARVRPTGPAVFNDYDFELEHRLLDALAEHSSVPVPKVLFNESDPTLLGAPFIVLEFLEGQVAGDDPPYSTDGWVRELTTAQRATMADSALRAIVALHAVDWRAAGLEFLEKREGSPTDLHPTGTDAQITAYRNYFEWAREGTEYPFVTSAFAWLRSHQPPDDETPVLTWGDARIGNLLFASDQSVAAVLDWEMAALGSPESDLGYWLSMVAHFTECIGVPNPEGFPSREEFVRRYEELSGRPVRHLEFHEVFGAVKTAVMVVRLASILIRAGLLPPEANLATSNAATTIIARLTGLPAPEVAEDTWMGRR
ncbi:MAG TPA: phosphotransferase family protein [Pseudonocardia sp.]|jgi:aminoglycoside phosphotransferase (APT) family kinase protein